MRYEACRPKCAQELSNSGLGLRWARGGHRVLFGSRDPAKAEAVAAEAPGAAQAGDFDAAAAFGEGVLHTVRNLFPSSLLREPQALSGKIVIDCNNSEILGLDVPDPDRRAGFHFLTPVPSLAERLAADVPQARVFKAFNTMSARLIELDRETLAPHRVSVFLCADDPQMLYIRRHNWRLAWFCPPRVCAYYSGNGVAAVPVKPA